MRVLNENQIKQFQRDGVLTISGAVDPDLLENLKSEFEAWVEDSKNYDTPYGKCTDGRPRFDLEPGHSAQQPALRRVQAPTEISNAYFDAMANSKMTAMVADLIGPNIKLHHTKLNSKLPGATTAVRWHQDFCYTPHTNSLLYTSPSPRDGLLSRIASSA